jgi:hypothetical protein
MKKPTRVNTDRASPSSCIQGITQSAVLCEDSSDVIERAKEQIGTIS